MPLTTLSKGYEKPTNPTYGDLFWPALERNIQRMNDHTHDGFDGAQIAANLQTVDSADWGADLGGGSYRQLLTMPGALVFNDTRIEVRRDDGQVVYATIERVSFNTFYLYTNDNTQSYVVSYV